MKNIIIKLINFYRIAISPYTSKSCRFQPTCSRYALDAIEKYGILKAIYKILIRILKCNPWYKGGPFDPA